MGDKMPVLLCDTGPLVALSSLGLIEVLSKLYSPAVTSAVLDEWHARADRSALPSSFSVIDVKSSDPLLAVQLDRGEASVIQAAIETNCKIVLIDEQKGRKLARRIFGLQTIGTAGILVQLKQRGWIRDIKALFSQLREQNYWIDDKIVAWALQEAS
jgi:predicted nucleic acid-binding protein